MGKKNKQAKRRVNAEADDVEGAGDASEAEADAVARDASEAEADAVARDAGDAARELRRRYGC